MGARRCFLLLSLPLSAERSSEQGAAVEGQILQFSFCSGAVGDRC